MDFSRGPSPHQVARAFRAAYGPMRPEDFGNELQVLDQVCRMILVQRSAMTDGVTQTAYDRARGMWRSSTDIIRDGKALQELVNVLRPFGMARRRALAVAAAQSAFHHGYGWEAFLRLTSFDGLLSELTRLPMIGVKSAIMVAWCCYGHDAFAVDTHCRRVCTKLGWRWRDDLELNGALPRGDRAYLHMSMFRLGRSACGARKPGCPTCPLRPLCQSRDAWRGGEPR